ncbi:MAG TPA: hypothetical protein VIP11_22070 [Gemmatimonadaceae bacterium]
MIPKQSDAWRARLADQIRGTNRHRLIAVVTGAWIVSSFRDDDWLNCLSSE